MSLIETGMIKLISLSVVALVCLPFLPSHAANYDLGDRRRALIDDPLRIGIQSGPTELTREKIQQAIAVGAITKDWRVITTAEGRMEFLTLVRGRHMVKIRITFDHSSYNVRYLDSNNVMYQELKAKGGTLRAIHRNYNACGFASSPRPSI